MDVTVSRRRFVRNATLLLGTGSYGRSAASHVAAAAPMLQSPVGQTEDEIEIPTSAYKARVVRIQSELAKRDINVLAIFSSAGWSSGWDSRYLARHWPGIVIVPAVGEPTLVAQDAIPPRPRVVDTWIADVRFGRGWEAMIDESVARLRELREATGKIAIGGDLDWAARSKLAIAFPKTRFEDGNDVHDQVRLVKDEYEIRCLQRAADIADAELKTAFQAVRPGRRVYEVIADTYQTALAQGAVLLDSRDLVGYSSEGTARFTVGSKAHRLQSGETFVFEPIPFYFHYNVETPVTFALGKVSDDHKAIAALDFEAFQASVEALKPGAPVLDAVKASHAVLNPKGHPVNTNGPGHFIGIGNIERPPIEREPSVILKPGMVVALHGNLAVANKTKHWIGCCFLITETGKQALTKTKLEPLFQV